VPLAVCPLADERSGLISTRAPGAAEVYASLHWRNPECVPEGLTTLDFPSEDTENSRWHLDVEEIAGCRVLTGCVISMTAEALGDRIDAFLRAASVYAARTDAVLQTRVLRIAEPVVPSMDLVGDLARQLRGVGISVRFGRVWTPLPPGSCCGVGARGVEEQIEALLLSRSRRSAG
jgi:hypothetical protein